MCGRYSFFESEELYDRFDVERSKKSVRESYNVTPGRKMPVITEAEPKKISMKEWGIVPPWKKETSGRGIINARSETVAEKRTFKKLYQNGRCLIPASGYFEWQKSSDGKIPYYHHLKKVACLHLPACAMMINS